MLKLYDRRNVQEMLDLEHVMYLEPMADTKYYCRLEKDIIVHSTLPRIFINTYLFEVFEDYNISVADRRKFMFTGDYRKGALDKYMNNLINNVKVEDEEVNLSHLLGDIVSCFYKLACTIGDNFSMDHSMIGYYEAFLRDEQFAKLFTNPPINKKMNPWEVERQYDYIIDTVEKADVYPISDFVKSGVKANRKQILAMFQTGLQPDYIDPGKVRNLTTSGFLNGIDNIEDMHHLDNGSLEATIKGKNDVQEPGELSKLLTVALTDTKLNKDVTREVVHDCGTHDYLKVVMTKKGLKRFKYKYYVDPNTHAILGYVNTDREDLIGKTLYLRNIGMCKCDGHVCEVCAGANYKFLQDTKVFKNNLSELVSHKLAGIFQKVISIKHSNSAELKDMPTVYDGVEYKTLEDFCLANKHLVARFEFDKLYFHPEVIVEVASKDGYTYDRIYLNGIELEIHDKPVNRTKDGGVQVYIPNESVLLRARYLNYMLKGHSSSSPMIPKKYKWDRTGLDKMSRADQIASFYWYLDSMIDLGHSIYYESLVHALIRDANDLSQRPSETCEHITALHVNAVVAAANTMNNMSSRIHHGYVRKSLSAIVKSTKPTEADVLYNVIGPRDSNEGDTAAKLWEVMHTEECDVNLCNDGACVIEPVKYTNKNMYNEGEDE